jgi:hypothetical protein
MLGFACPSWFATYRAETLSSSSHVATVLRTVCPTAHSNPAASSPARRCFVVFDVSRSFPSAEQNAAACDGWIAEDDPATGEAFGYACSGRVADTDVTDDVGRCRPRQRPTGMQRTGP